LDYFIDNGTAKDIRLKYNTNLVKVPDWLVEKWSHFKRIKLNCSIDAVGELDHYIRYPSKWPTVEKNFNKLQELNNANIEIHCTVQMYNILRMPALFDWAEPFEYKVYLNILNHPDYLNIQCLPQQLKQQAEQQLEPYLHKPKVKDVIKYMWDQDWSHKLPDFYKYTHTLDQSRDEDLYSIVPEFKQYEQ
jgi:glutamate-1-semialdehyde 2,1-aminomutase